MHDDEVPAEGPPVEQVEEAGDQLDEDGDDQDRGTGDPSTCLTERNSGQRKWFGYTDQSLISTSGMKAVPVATWTPWVSR